MRIGRNRSENGTIRTMFPGCSTAWPPWPGIAWVIRLSLTLTIVEALVVSNSLGQGTSMLPGALKNGSLSTVASAHLVPRPLTDLSYKCTPGTPGIGTQRISCIKALSTMDFQTGTQKTWGRRGLPYEYPMPQRWVGRMTLPDASRRNCRIS